jgi:hypothetical protein
MITRVAAVARERRFIAAAPLVDDQLSAAYKTHINS